MTCLELVVARAEYATTYMMFPLKPSQDPMAVRGPRPVPPDEGDPQDWVLVSVAPVILSLSEAYIFWTWKNAKWWQPQG